MLLSIQLKSFTWISNRFPCVLPWRNNDDIIKPQCRNRSTNNRRGKISHCPAKPSKQDIGHVWFWELFFENESEISVEDHVSIFSKACRATKIRILFRNEVGEKMPSYAISRIERQRERGSNFPEWKQSKLKQRKHQHSIFILQAGKWNVRRMR